MGPPPADDVAAWFLTAADGATPTPASTPTARTGRTGATVTAWRGPRATGWALVHGAEYRCLLDTWQGLGAGDLLLLTDWRGDGDERLDGSPGSELATVLVGLVERGVDVRRSAAVAPAPGTPQRAGGDPPRRGGQRGGGRDPAGRAGPPGRFASPEDGAGPASGARGRRRGLRRRHRPVPRAATTSDTTATRRPSTSGRSTATARPGTTSSPRSAARRSGTWPARSASGGTIPRPSTTATRGGPASPGWREPRCPKPLPPAPAIPEDAGPHAVQVLRTYSRRRPAYLFSTEGERSIARAYGKAFRRARRLIYIEDQYLWSADVTASLSEALRSQEDLHLIALVPRYPEQGGRASEPLERVGHDEAVGQVVEAGGDQVAIYDLENDEGTPVYVHAKVCVVDDVWAIVGSDNLNLRSWTHDSELSCGILDSTRCKPARRPRRPGRRRPRLRPRPAAAADGRAPRPWRRRRRPARSDRSVRGVERGCRRARGLVRGRLRRPPPARPGPAPPPRARPLVAAPVGAPSTARGRSRRPPEARGAAPSSDRVRRHGGPRRRSGPRTGTRRRGSGTCARPGGRERAPGRWCELPRRRALQTAADDLVIGQAQVHPLVASASSQHGSGNAEYQDGGGLRGRETGGTGSRVSTENASNVAWPASAGRWATRAAWAWVWAACVGSSAATATLVSLAQRSALELTQPPHVVVGDHRSA